MPKEKITREELGKQMMETTIIKSNKKIPEYIFSVSDIAFAASLSFPLITKELIYLMSYSICRPVSSFILSKFFAAKLCLFSSYKIEPYK